MSRLDRLYRALEEAGLAGLIVVPGPNLRYLTGIELYPSERLSLGILAPGSPPLLLLPALEVPRARAHLAIEARLVGWSDEQGPQEALAGLFTQAVPLSSERIGVEYRFMRLFEWHSLRQARPQGQFKPADTALAQLRMVKDAGEIDAMRRAAAILERGLRIVLETLRPGMTEQQAARAWQIAIAEAGADEIPPEPIVASGPHGAFPHTRPTDRVMSSGDMVTFDGVARSGGYYADLTRTVALGRPAEELGRIYELVRAANQAGRGAVGPGTPAEEVDRAARDLITAAGYGDAFLHRTGHGLGLEVHEPPDIVRGNRAELQPGTTFTVEPGIYVEGLGGVRIEDDLVVTAAGAESLTAMERDLLIL